MNPYWVAPPGQGSTDRYFLLDLSCRNCSLLISHHFVVLWLWISEPGQCDFDEGARLVRSPDSPPRKSSFSDTSSAFAKRFAAFT